MIRPQDERQWQDQILEYETPEQYRYLTESTPVSQLELLTTVGCYFWGAK